MDAAAASPILRQPLAAPVHSLLLYYSLRLMNLSLLYVISDLLKARYAWWLLQSCHLAHTELAAQTRGTASLPSGLT